MSHIRVQPEVKLIKKKKNKKKTNRVTDEIYANVNVLVISTVLTTDNGECFDFTLNSYYLCCENVGKPLYF